LASSMKSASVSVTTGLGGLLTGRCDVSGAAMNVVGNSRFGASLSGVLSTADSKVIGGSSLLP
jgi:hypothetical protein